MQSVLHTQYILRQKSFFFIYLYFLFKHPLVKQSDFSLVQIISSKQKINLSVPFCYLFSEVGFYGVSYLLVLSEVFSYVKYEQWQTTLK